PPVRPGWLLPPETCRVRPTVRLLRVTVSRDRCGRSTDPLHLFTTLLLATPVARRNVSVRDVIHSFTFQGESHVGSSDRYRQVVQRRQGFRFHQPRKR